MRFETLNVRRLCRTGSLKMIAVELAKYNLDLVAVQEVRLDDSGSHPADNYTFVHGNGNVNHCLGANFFVHEGVISAVRKIELFYKW
jgi:hypothetical protein